MKGKWESFNGQIRHNISVTAGQSGSPIFFKKYGKYYAVGMHTHGEMEFNSGIIFNRRIRSMIA